MIYVQEDLQFHKQVRYTLSGAVVSSGFGITSVYQETSPSRTVTRQTRLLRHCESRDCKLEIS
jgi:ABC-type molybdenum transport system ATPase subunit/photorepair protein PhrA